MKKIYSVIIAAMALFVSLTACAGDFVPGGYQNIQTEQPAINGCTTCHKAEKAEALAELSGDIGYLDKQAGLMRTMIDSALSTNTTTDYPTDNIYREGSSSHVHNAACLVVKLKPDISTA